MAGDGNEAQSEVPHHPGPQQKQQRSNPTPQILIGKPVPPPPHHFPHTRARKSLTCEGLCKLSQETRICRIYGDVTVLKCRLYDY